MNQKSKIKKFSVRKVTSVAAALAVVLISSNAIVYAASGSTWVEKIIVKVNGEERELDAEVTTYDNGEEQGKVITVDVPDGADSIEYSESMDMDGTAEETTEGTADVYYGEPELKTCVTVDENQILLTIGDVEIDVTEDYADGACSGSVEIDGVTYQYEVTGNTEEYSVSVWY